MYQVAPEDPCHSFLATLHPQESDFSHLSPSERVFRIEYLITILQFSDQDLGSVAIPFFTFLASLHTHARSSLLECFSLVGLVPLLKKVGEDSVRPVGVTEPLFKVIGLC